VYEHGSGCGDLRWYRLTYNADDRWPLISWNIFDRWLLKLDRELWPFLSFPNRRSKRNERYGERSNYPKRVDYAGIVKPFQVGEELIEGCGKRGRHCGGEIQSQSAVDRKACRNG
jgi:hypothetical protein